ncbi:hypothetical protein DVH24_001488 [Malus domestica]|uniref:Uncharacterized protein n=1 Tax=Malus domestica TaxID=3750 RepID=A0A498K4Q6_MALDO|nr:hypothetical protein DVH24_001488 [Malus domestica]
MAFSTTPKTQMPLPPPPTPPPLPPPPPPADHLTGVEVAVRLCRDAQGYHLPRKTGSGNVSVKNSIISTHLQRFCNALKENGKSKGFEESSITTINALNDTIVNGKKLVLPVDTLLTVLIMLSLVVQATPYDYDNPGAGGGGGGDLLDAVVGNALALALVPVPVPAPAPPHQVVDGGAIIPVVGDGDGGGGPGAGGGVLPRDPVLSVYGSMLGWQNPFNFNSRFQFSLNLDIVHGQVMASEQAMALTWQQFYESADCVLALPHMDGKSVNLSRVLEGGIWANRGAVNIRAYGNVLHMEADMVALVYPGFAEFPAHTFQYWVDGICMTTQQILGLQWNVIDRYLTAVDCWDFSARQAAVMGAVAAEMPQDEIGNDMMEIPPELVNE